MTLATNPKHPGWDVGVEVIHGEAIRAIEKVYANGRVVVYGVQWTPAGTVATRTTACGERDAIRLATPEARAKLAKSMAIVGARRAADRLINSLYATHGDRLLPNLPAIEALLAALDGQS